MGARSTGLPSIVWTVAPSTVMSTISPSFDHQHGAGVGQDGRDVGGQERLPFAEANDQRADHPCRHNPARLTGAHDDHRICALRSSDRPANRFEEIAVVLVGNEVHQHLGIGLGQELVTLFDQGFLEREEVLNDPVVDEHELTGRICVRVSVHIVRHPVGSPTGVSNAGGSGDRLILAADRRDAASSPPPYAPRHGRGS